MLDMLDPSWGKGSQDVWPASNSQVNDGFRFTAPWPPMEKRTTVKDLLKMKRRKKDEMFSKWKHWQAGHQLMNLATTPTNDYYCQNWRYQQEDEWPGNSPEHMETSPVNQSPPQMDLSPTRAPADLVPAYFPPTPPAAQLIPPPLNAPAPPAAPLAPAMTLFHWQIQQQLGKMKGVSAELLNMQDSDGDTSLHIAVAQGKRALAYVLAENMAVSGTLDLQEHNGQTALHIAVATNQHLIVSDLLEHGAQMNILDSWGRSPLHVCVEKGHVRSLLSILKYLKVNGKELDADLVNYDGLTSLHVAVLSHNAVIREAAGLEGTGLLKEAEILLKKAQMLFQCVKILLQMGASYGIKDQKSGRTGLHMAAEEANTQLMILFLNQPSSLIVVNLKTFSGNTALHIVCALENCKGQVDAVKMLIRRGADPGAKNFENELPCQLIPEGATGEKVRVILKGRCIN